MNRPVSSRFAATLVIITAVTGCTPSSPRIDGASRAGVIFGDTSSGRVDGARCRNTGYGIVVSPKALPFIGRGNTCPLAQGR